MNWKNFDLQLFFQGVAGNKIYNQLRHRLEGTGTNSVLSPVMKNAWMQHTNDAGETYYDGSIPNPKTRSTTMSQTASSRMDHTSA